MSRSQKHRDPKDAECIKRLAKKASDIVLNIILIYVNSSYIVAFSISDVKRVFKLKNFYILDKFCAIKNNFLKFDFHQNQNKQDKKFLRRF